MLPLLALLPLTTGSILLVPGALDAAGARDRGLLLGFRRWDVQSTRMETAACAPAHANYAYLSTNAQQEGKGDGLIVPQ